MIYLSFIIISADILVSLHYFVCWFISVIWYQGSEFNVLTVGRWGGNPFSLSIRVQQTVEAGNIGFMDVWTWYNVKYLWASTFNTNTLLFSSLYEWCCSSSSSSSSSRLKSNWFSSRLIFSLFALLDSRTHNCHVFHLVLLFPLMFFFWFVCFLSRLFVSPLLLFFSSSLSLASLAMPSFSRPTRTNLMGDKSGWLTTIKKRGEKVWGSRLGMATLSLTAL